MLYAVNNLGWSSGLSTYSKISGFIPDSSSQHAEVSLEESRVWMCVWLGELDLQ